MSKIDDEVVTVDTSFPKIVAVQALEGYNVLIKWKGGRQTVVDLAPAILAFKVYAPLRDDRALFETVHVIGSTIVGWGDDAIDMHVSQVEQLASETMDSVSFQTFLDDMKLTWDGAAAQLGLSRRMVGYYAKGSVIPRYIVLACSYLRFAQNKAEVSSVAHVDRAPALAQPFVTRADLPGHMPSTNKPVAAAKNAPAPRPLGKGRRNVT